MRRRPVLLLCAFAASALGFSSSASADVFGPISLVDSSPLQQADYAHDPAVSADGRYVVFDGSVGGVTGVWRKENKPGGTFEEVAGGDAELPSVSQEGRYVSFTTTEGAHLAEVTNGLPDPFHETHESPNVYVRDMSKPAAAGGAFEVVSAPNGSSEPLSYEYPTGHGREGETQQEREAREKTEREEHEQEVERYGSAAAGRSAISANGRRVAFVTTAVSNLAGDGTPALQVAVRDLETRATELVSVKADPSTGLPVINQQTGQPEPIAPESEGSGRYGAVRSRGKPQPFTVPEPYVMSTGTGASISADGSTVAWMGQDIGQQARFLPGETQTGLYSEPLWRRVVNANNELSEQEPTRRVTGGSDPTNPACEASGERVLPNEPSAGDPCQGPFNTQSTENFGVLNGGEGDEIPRLSTDGYTIAFLAAAPPVSLGSDFGVEADNRHTDLFVANMHEGLTRDEAIREVTQLASGVESDEANNAPIIDFAVSPDGTQVAFSTKRTVFPLSSLAYVSTPASVPGMVELFDVDLVDNTLTRVTHGYEGGASSHPHKETNTNQENPYEKGQDGALSPSFSAEGEWLTFSSTASNLVFGDGNTPPLLDHNLDGSDVFALQRVVFPPTSTPQVISPAPPGPSISPVWEIGATSSSLSNGSVRLDVAIPAAGTLRTGVSAAVEVTASSSRATRHGAKRTTRASVQARAVAPTSQSSEPEGLSVVSVIITLSPAYRALASRAGGLSALASVSFAAPGQPTLKQTVPVTFVAKASAHSSRRAKTTARKSSREKARHR